MSNFLLDVDQFGQNYVCFGRIISVFVRIFSKGYKSSPNHSEYNIPNFCGNLPRYY